MISDRKHPHGTDDAVREHIQRALEANWRTSAALHERATRLEQEGHRIISGGQTSGADGWEITDWRTKALIAEGQDGDVGYVAALERLDPDETWFHADQLWDGLDVAYVESPDLPRSLAHALDDWIASGSTSDEEIAQVVGWSVEKVREHR